MTLEELSNHELIRLLKLYAPQASGNKLLQEHVDEIEEEIFLRMEDDNNGV